MSLVVCVMSLVVCVMSVVEGDVCSVCSFMHLLYITDTHNTYY